MDMTKINKEEKVTTYAKATKKAKQLIEAVKYFHTVKTIKLPRGMKCPFEIVIDVDNLDILNHDQLSESAVGTGMIRWDCPFCGKHFEE